MVTRRQQEILTQIELLTHRNGVPPTYAEIMKELGIKNVNALVGALESLKRKGLVVWEKRKSRTIRVVEAFPARGDNFELVDWSEVQGVIERV